MIWICSFFYEKAVDLLESLNTPAYNIARLENNHLSLIEKAVAMGETLTISTGMASLGELDDTVGTAR